MTDSAGAFLDATGTTRLDINHYVGRRNKHVVKFSFTKIVADPLVPAQNVRVSMSASFSLDGPLQGATNAELKALGDGIAAWLTASSGANITKLASFEV
jgi:hypothetical protein